MDCNGVDTFNFDTYMEVEVFATGHDYYTIELLTMYGQQCPFEVVFVNLVSLPGFSQYPGVVTIAEVPTMAP